MDSLPLAFFLKQGAFSLPKSLILPFSPLSANIRKFDFGLLWSDSKVRMKKQIYIAAAVGFLVAAYGNKLPVVSTILAKLPNR